MTEDLLSSTEAAALLGVSASSVKRWADDGVLSCVKTAGQHRRFARSTLERFRLQQAAMANDGSPHDGAGLSEVDTWAELLVAQASSQVLEARLLAARGALGSWLRVAELLGAVLTEVGQRWQHGRITVLDEHLASERLQRALARMSEWLPVSPDAPHALLATAENDDHTLGLSLVELCLREQGWSALWAGRRTPMSEVANTLTHNRHEVRLVAVSASAASSDANTLAPQAVYLARICEAARIPLLLGGSGAWPQSLPGATIVRDLRSLPSLLPRP